MTTNYTNAVNETFDLFNTAWQANAGGIVDYIPTIYWQGVNVEVAPTGVYWARIGMVGVAEPQTNIGTQQNGMRRYTASGLVTVSLFCPMSDAPSMQNGRKLAQVAKAAFRGKTTVSGVLFRNTVIKEIAAQQQVNRFNIVSQYEYDEIA